MFDYLARCKLKKIRGTLCELKISQKKGLFKPCVKSLCQCSHEEPLQNINITDVSIFTCQGYLQLFIISGNELCWLSGSLLGLVKRFPHQDVFSNSSMDYPGLLGNVGKCSVGCEGALKKVHLKHQNEQTTNEKSYVLHNISKLWFRVNITQIRSITLRNICLPEWQTIK